MSIFLRGGLALALGVAVAGSVGFAPTAAFAQKGAKYSADFLKAIGAPTKAGEKSAIENEIAAQQWDAATARVRQIDGIAKASADEKDLNAVFKIQIGQGSKNDELFKEGLEGRIAAGKLSPEDQMKYTRNLAAVSLQKNDYNGAAQYLERVIQMNPNDTATLSDLGAIYSRQKRVPEAMSAFDRAAKAAEASGQKAPEALYGSQLQLALDNNLSDKVLPAAVSLVKAYPTPNNWNAAIYSLRKGTKVDEQTDLDAYRLQRATSAIQGGGEYADYVNSAQLRGLPAEARSVLDEGVSKGVLPPGSQTAKELGAILTPAKIAADKASLPQLEKDARASKTGKLARATADGYISHREWAKAADLYAVALQKGGEDAMLVNTRIGIAKAMLNDKAGAREAFAKVQGGTRGNLARLWELFVDQKA